MLNVFILGMHRSGTSATAGIVNLLGFDSGSELLEANENNKKGYFENKFIYLLNKKILNDFGLNWDTIEEIELNTDELYNTYGEEAISIIKKEFGSSNRFFIKDPRICHLFAFWERVLENCNIQSKVILPLRNPIEVAKSLEKRNKFPINKGLILWINHFMNAELSSRGMSRIFVNYNDLLDKYTGTIKKLVTFLNVELSDEINSNILDFLDSSLKHQKVPLNEVERNILPIIDKLVKLIKEEKLEDSLLLDAIYTEYKLILSVFFSNGILDSTIHHKEIAKKVNSFRKKSEELADNDKMISDVVNVIKCKTQSFELESSKYIKEIQNNEQLIRTLKDVEISLNSKLDFSSEYIKELEEDNAKIHNQLQRQQVNYALLEQKESFDKDSLLLSQAQIKKYESEILQLKNKEEELLKKVFTFIEDKNKYETNTDSKINEEIYNLIELNTLKEQKSRQDFLNREKELKSSTDSKIHQLSIENSVYQEKIKTLKNTCQIETIALSKSLKENEEKSHLLTEMEKSREDKSNQIKTLETKIHALKATIIASDTKSRSFGSKIHTLRATMANSEKKSKTLETKIHALNTSIVSSNQKYASLEKEYNRITKEILPLRKKEKQLLTTQNNFTRLENKYKSLKFEKEKLLTYLNKFHDENQKLNQNTKEIIIDLIETKNKKRSFFGKKTQKKRYNYV